MAGVLKKAGWAAIPPEQYLSDMDEQFLSFWEQVKDYTLISPERGWALTEAVRYICRNNIPGDIAECGVWKGGACLLASLVLATEESVSSSRRIWLYDTFSGMPEPGTEDKIAVSGQSLSERNPQGWWAAGMEEVKGVLKASPLPESSFVFVPGRVEETLNTQLPGRLSLLRLDTDWYASTLKELQVLYPLLISEGVLIVDDYGHFTGARQAVDEFFAEHHLLIHRSDYTGRVLVKPAGGSITEPQSCAAGAP